MTAVGLAVLLIAGLSTAWWWEFYGPATRPQHGGAGPGALTVQHLLDRVDAETGGLGHHRLHEPMIARPVARSVSLVDTAAVPRNAAPTLPSQFHRPTDDVLRQVLDGLQRL